MRSRTWLVTLPLLLAATVPGFADEPWCAGADALRLDVDPATGTVLVSHDGALYSCCPEPVVYDLALDGDVLTVTERVLEASPCDCICCFDFAATVTDLTPGSWTVVLRWLDAEMGGWQELSDRIDVPAPGGGGEPLAALAVDPLCEGPTGLEPGPTSGTWGAIKACYR